MPTLMVQPFPNGSSYCRWFSRNCEDCALAPVLCIVPKWLRKAEETGEIPQAVADAAGIVNGDGTCPHKQAKGN